MIQQLTTYATEYAVKLGIDPTLFPWIIAAFVLILFMLSLKRDSKRDGIHITPVRIILVVVIIVGTIWAVRRHDRVHGVQSTWRQDLADMMSAMR